MNVDARDDSAMASVTVWLAGDKVAWIPGGGPAISATVPLDVPAGTSPVTVEAVDEHGARTVEVGWVRGVDSGTAENADEP